MLLRIKSAFPWYVTYENDDDPPATPPATGDPPATPPATGDPPPNPEDDKPKFSQKQLNKFLAEEKRKHQKQIETQVKQLEQLQKNKNLTEKEKGDLQNRIEELQSSLLTKEELASKEKEKILTEGKKTVESLSTERDNWRNLFFDSTITRAIQDEAIRAEAYSSNQIVSLLRGSTRLVEVLDADGNVVPNQFMAKVKMADTDKDGKPTTLDLTVAEALKRMKDRPDEFGNLFKSGVVGGLGGNGNSGGTKPLDPTKLQGSDYRKWRSGRGW